MTRGRGRAGGYARAMGGVAGVLSGAMEHNHTLVASYRRKLHPRATRVDTAMPACANWSENSPQLRRELGISFRSRENAIMRHYAAALNRPRVFRTIAHGMSVEKMLFFFLWIRNKPQPFSLEFNL